MGVLINLCTAHEYQWSRVHCGHGETELHTTNLTYPSYSLITSVTYISKSHCAFIIMVSQSKWSDEGEGTTIRTINQSTRRSILEDFILCLHCCDNALSIIFSTQCSIHRNGYLLFRRFRKIAKSDYWLRHVCPPVRLSAWNNSAPTSRIFMKLR